MNLKLDELNNLFFLPNFPTDIDQNLIKYYIHPISKLLYETDKNCVKNVKKSLKQTEEIIQKKIIDVKDILTSISENLNTFKNSPYEFNLPQFFQPSYLTNIYYAKYKYLNIKVKKYEKKLQEKKLIHFSKKYDILINLNRLLIFLKNNNLPYIIEYHFIDITTEWIGKLSKKFSKLQFQILSMKYYLNHSQIFLSLTPKPFRSTAQNLIFFRELITEASNNTLSGLIYFPELLNETILPLFFESKSSPFYKNSISFYEGGNDPELISNWILNTSEMLYLYETEDENDRYRCEIISIFLTRYLFSSKYPLFYPKSTFDYEFYKKMNLFSKKTPKEAGILEKYIPIQCINSPVKEMFQIDSVSRAPIEWLREAEFQTCPLDVAYYIGKVHESLSVMAVIRLNINFKNSNNDNLIHQQIPGFDDIFAIWLSMLCSSEIFDPKRLLKFIQNFSNLPGFTGRIQASIAYLEASIAHIDSL